ncbi:MAG TPA: hypothetical protein P5205_01735 [Candidatus Paceibacterota bacterium]|nr:hypothetical protein [Verrucomicrobiota bacterium]HSA09067.1 hypothetical protein [Candidatus Paceibacterota bacterium]
MSANATHSSGGRRKFLLTGLISLVAGLLGLRKTTAAAVTSSGDPVTTRMRLGQPPGQPLDTMLLFERGDENNGRAMTHEVLSLIHQEKGKHSYPWTLYASLETHHETGDACVVCSRLHKHGPGWSTGLHSEVFNHGRGVALGVNIEMSNDYPGAEQTVIAGLNIQAVGGPVPMQYGIQIHDGANHFQTAIHLPGKGATGIDLPGAFQTGLNLHNNNIRLNEGACVELDGKGKIKLRYRKNRIEFLNGDHCFAHLDVNAKDHAL